MSHATYLVGDVFDRLAEIEDGSVDLIVTSPPFLALRSYLPADHPDKAKEIGSEPTPAAFIDVMLALSAELRRVLAPHGSICVELGDTYAGSGGAGGDYNDGSLRDGQPKFDGSMKYARTHDPLKGPPIPRVSGTAGGGGGADWPLAKSKTLIPELYRLALAYGINPLTGQQSPAGQWRIRNVVTWCRPNPPVGALGDKWRPATSDIVVAARSAKRYWDDLATRKLSDYHRDTLYVNDKTPPGQRPNMSQHTVNSGGAPLLDYWEIPPGGYPGSHYAVYPASLIVPLIKAMAPPKVCRECGEPVRRIVGEASYLRNDSDLVPARLTMLDGKRPADGVNQHLRPDGANTSVTKQQDTLGWSDCGHNDYRPALILDPFAGSGTTGVVATGHGHDCILIDLDERNAELARERIGDLFLTVEGVA